MAHADIIEDGQRHAAYGVALEDLDVMVIEPSRTMQTILRSMLMPMKPKRVRMYEFAQDALRDMLVEAPNLVVTDWAMQPMSGRRLLKLMRHSSMAPLCFVPVIVVSGAATRSAVEAAFRLGAHAVLVKPLSPAALRRRFEWILQDDRPFRLDGEAYVVDGVAEVLDAQARREQLPSILADLREGDEPRSRTADAQSIVDRIVKGDADVPERAFAAQRARPRPAPAEMSPTLRRLIHRRTQADREAAADAAAATVAAVVAASPKKKKGGGGLRTRWAEIWGR